MNTLYQRRNLSLIPNLVAQVKAKRPPRPWKQRKASLWAPTSQTRKTLSAPRCRQTDLPNQSNRWILGTEVRCSQKTKSTMPQCSRERLSTPAHPNKLITSPTSSAFSINKLSQPPSPKNLPSTNKTLGTNLSHQQRGLRVTSMIQLRTKARQVFGQLPAIPVLPSQYTPTRSLRPTRKMSWASPRWPASKTKTCPNLNSSQKPKWKRWSTSKKVA